MAAIILLFLLVASPVLSAVPGGFNFSEGISHTILPFELYKNLIIVKAHLNDSVPLRLILDTGTRSVLLYGKRFKGLKTLLPSKKITVSGWGSGEGVAAQMAYPNSISLGEISGHHLNLAVVTHRKMVSDNPSIDGVIGYDLFIKFAVEINYATRTIHLYKKLEKREVAGFQSVPMEVHLARPQVTSTIQLHNNRELKLNLLIDTGSSLALTIYSKEKEGFRTTGDFHQLGTGLAGSVFGYHLKVNTMSIDRLPVADIDAHLVYVQNHPDKNFTIAGSLGAGFLKDLVVIFDYPNSTLYLKSRSVDLLLAKE